MPIMHGYARHSKPSAANCQWHLLVVSPRPKREWGKACSKPNELPPSQKRRRNGHCAQKCGPRPSRLSSTFAQFASTSSLRCGPQFLECTLLDPEVIPVLRVTGEQENL